MTEILLSRLFCNCLLARCIRTLCLSSALIYIDDLLLVICIHLLCVWRCYCLSLANILACVHFAWISSRILTAWRVPIDFDFVHFYCYLVHIYRSVCDGMFPMLLSRLDVQAQCLAYKFQRQCPFYWRLLHHIRSFDTIYSIFSLLIAV